MPAVACVSPDASIPKAERGMDLTTALSLVAWQLTLTHSSQNKIDPCNTADKPRRSRYEQ